MNPETSLRALMQRDAKIWSEKIQLTFGRDVRDDDTEENTKPDRGTRGSQKSQLKQSRNGTDHSPSDGL
jgi:hypothetical protein